MGLRRWLDERLDLGQIRRALLDREVPDRLTWWHTLGSATLTVFVVQVVTGLVLATYYAPAPDHAYDSVRYIEGEVAGGALLRGIHHWAASAMVVLVLAHMIRVFVSGAYKYPREVNWLLGVGLFVVVLGFSFTGYLLPWDQKAYWATQVGTGIAGTTPVLGPALVAVLRSGSDLGAATLTRFYAFHILWLPVLLVGLVLLHIALVIRQGIAAPPGLLDRGAPARTDDPAYAGHYQEAYAASKQKGTRFWPDIIAKDAIVSLLVVGIIVALAAWQGATLEPPADPTDTAYVPRPEWYFLPLFQLLTLVPGSWESVIAVGVPTALIVTLLALPLVDRRSTRHPGRRPLAMGVLVAVLAGSGLLLGAALRQSRPAVAPEVGRLLTSTERAGRALYEMAKCGDCHVVAGRGGDRGPELTTVGLRHSAAWLHSFIEHPAAFHPDTKMPAFGPPALSHTEVEELARYLSTLRGGAGPDIQPQYQDTFPPARPAGRTTPTP